MTAVVAASAGGKNTGTSALNVTLPEGIQAGDLLLITFMSASASAYLTDRVSKGWWDIGSQAVNSRAWGTIARIYNPSDPASTYQLTLNASAYATYISRAIRGHAVAVAADIQQGPRLARSASNGVVTAPSLTTPTGDRLILAYTGEASNALGTYAITADAGFTLGLQVTEGPTAAVDIEWVTAWQKVQPAPGATGDLTLTYTAASMNGIGAQYSIPSGVTPGSLGLRISAAPTSTSLTVGADLLVGSALVAVLRDGATEVARQAMTVDGSSGWGTTTFSGLTPDKSYTIQFEIDGVVHDASTMIQRTLPTPGTALSFVAAIGSCQFTGSNHPIWDIIAADQPRVLGHMGDLHYEDSLTLAGWRAGVESSLNAPRMRALLASTHFLWSWDNHDRILLDDGGAGNALNYGKTDPATNTEWRKLAGTAGWASSDTAGRTWVIGRVRFIQTDQWTAKTDPDAGIVPAADQTFLGAAQKQWFKDTLAAATEEVIVWLCQWTGQGYTNGRWNSYQIETGELETWINARPTVKSRMIMIGGDSHSLQVTDGSRTTAQGQRFAGIPNYNISGFNRTSDAPQGGDGWTADASLRAPGQPEANWGGYSRMTFTDDGDTVTVKWDGVRVDNTGSTDIMATQTVVFGSDPVTGFRFVEVIGGVERDLAVFEKSGATETTLTIIEQ